MGRGELPRHLPPSRRVLRPAHRPGADAARNTACRHLPRRRRGRDRDPRPAIGRTLSEVRCFGWGDALYTAYHDDEWGRPIRNERGVYERLCLEGFQSGLSWLTILRKREAFRNAFEDFDPDRVARFTEDDIERLLGDEGIVRHRGKIEATITNARATVALRTAAQPLHELLWAHAPAARLAPRSHADWLSTTPESEEVAKVLRRAGFKFIGPTTLHAAMQACGVVNDHLADCVVRADVEAVRSSFDPLSPS